jgi:hypothetical protein
MGGTAGWCLLHGQRAPGWKLALVKPSIDCMACRRAQIDALQRWSAWAGGKAGGNHCSVEFVVIWLHEMCCIIQAVHGSSGC